MRDDHCNLIAVWGSPNSGKTTFATKLALSIYDSYQSTVVVLYPDLEAPVLPVIFPNEKTEDLGSIGVPLSKTEIDVDDIVRNAITLKKRGNLVFLGYRTGDNRFTYPRYGRAKAEDFLEKVCSLADVVIVDCPSNLEGNGLASAGLEMANQIIRLASPDLKSISYYLSQLPTYADSKFRLEEHIQGLNTPNADVFMPVEEAKSHLKDVRFTVPYSQAVKLQTQTGRLVEPTSDKAFESRMKEIAQKVVYYGED